MYANLEPVPFASARYLGISVRADGFGFVVIEDSIALDCGVRVCDRTRSDECLGHQLRRILRIYSPSTVVLLKVGSPNTRTKRDAIARRLTRETKRYDIPLVRLSAPALRQFFDQFNASTKYEIAQAVVKILPELGWRLPEKRKPWQREQHRMSIFEAAAAVITCHKTIAEL